MKPGVYHGMPMAEYLAIPAVSSGLLVAIDQRCPAAAWHESWLNPAPTDEASAENQDVGSIAHSLLLEGNADVIQAVDAKDWRTNAAKEARDAARTAGKIPVLAGKPPRITAMIGTVRTYIESLRESEPAIWAAMQPGGGHSELVIVWQERDGTPCKIRPDRIALDRRVMCNYKTTLASAEPDNWFRRQATSLGYPISTAFYRRGVEQALRVEAVEVWLAQEQEAPFLCSLVGLDAMGLHAAELRMMRALRTWSACVASGRWPAYPSRVCYPETPPWEMARAEAEPAHGIPYEYEKLFEKRPPRNAAEAFVDSLPDERPIRR